jgi:uncharacterized protein (TIGR02246 family)
VSARDVRERLRLDLEEAEYDAIRELWKRHSRAEDARDIAGLLSTLTDDCVYTVDGVARRWEGHDGAARFYTELLTAFPDVRFDLRDIVIGPQGVCEEADVTATHRGAWLGVEPTGESLAFRVVIFFPWDRSRRLFTGERVYVSGIDLPSTM